MRRPEPVSKGRRALVVPDMPSYDHRFFRAICSYIINAQRNEFHLGVRLAGVEVCAKFRKDGTISQFAFTQPGQRPIHLYSHRGMIPPPKSPSKLEIAQIQVSVWGTWIPFLAWIHAEYGRRVGPNYTLFDWWSTNGRSFRFMDLPPELRNRVYEEITTPYTWPHINTRGDFKKHTMVVHHMRLSAACLRRAPSGHAPPSPTALPAVSKQVAAEFYRVANTYAIPHFIFAHHLQEVIAYPQIAICLRRISLGFPNWIYLRFLGYKGTHQNAFGIMPNAPFITMLHHIDTLEHINFNFQTMPTVQSPDHPNDSRYLCSWDPWLRFGQEEMKTKVSCQKLFVDMFLLFALEHIRHIPKVTLSGHVKNSTRENWATRFELERKGQHLDTASSKAWFLSRPREYFPFECHCKNSCHYWLMQGPLQKGCEKPEYSPHDWDYDPVKHDPFIYED